METLNPDLTWDRYVGNQPASEFLENSDPPVVIATATETDIVLAVWKYLNDSEWITTEPHPERVCSALIRYLREEQRRAM